MRAFWVAALLAAFGSSAIASDLQVVLSADAGASSSIGAWSVSGSGINAISDLPVSGSVSEIFTAARPDGTTVAALILGTDGALTLRELTGDGWGNAVSVATGVPVSRPSPVALTYTSRSGALVIAYATSGSAVLSLRSYADGSLSSASSATFTLSSTPVKVVLTPRASSNEVLVAAHDSSSKLGVCVWDTTTFRAAEIADSGYDGGTNRWDITWPRNGSAMVAWARATDTTLRVKTLTGDTWSSQVNTPSLAGAIGRVLLATDAARGGTATGLAMVTKNGALNAALYDAAAWTATTQMTTTLDTTRERPVELAFEGTGGALVCAWVNSGGSVINTRRYSGGAWGSANTSSAIGTGLAQLVVRPETGSESVIVAARREISGGSAGIASYVAYSQNGTVSGQDRTVFTGQTGSQVSGVVVPSAASVTPGVQDVSLTWDETRTLAAGSYRDLSFRDRTTLNLSAGTYVFRSCTQSGHDARFVCDTSGGDVRIIFDSGSVTFRDRFTISRSGSGVVIVEANNGAITFGYDDVVECIAMSHTSTITGRDRVRVTGYLYGVGNVAIGYDATITQPSWSVPVALMGSAMTQRMYAMAVDGGSPGSVVELTSGAGVESSAALPMAVSPIGMGSVTRVVRWREVAPE